MKTILTLSGGLDSCVLLWHLKTRGDEVRCLSVDYGQRHRKELDAAKKIADLAGAEHRIADLRGIRDLLAGSSQTSDITVPEGHYTDASMAITVVPNRNMILLALATAWAVSTKSDAVAYAAHAGDHAIYADCRPEFADSLAEAIALCDFRPVTLHRPFIGWTKSDIALRGFDLKAPLADTWSCYAGKERHCGRCGTCVERREAFNLAGIPDLTEYE